MTVNDLLSQVGDVPGTADVIAVIPTSKNHLIIKDIKDVRVKALEDTVVLLVDVDSVTKIQEEMLNE